MPKTCLKYVMCKLRVKIRQSGHTHWTIAGHCTACQRLYPEALRGRTLRLTQHQEKHAVSLSRISKSKEHTLRSQSLWRKSYQVTLARHKAEGVAECKQVSDADKAQIAKKQKHKVDKLATTKSCKSVITQLPGS